MSIVNKLTLRQLIKNKRRTTVTIVGVIISVAMIMAVATIGISFLDMFKRATIEQDGGWEAQYLSVSKDKLAIFYEEDKLKDIAQISKQGTATITDLGLDAKLNKSYVDVFALDEQAMDMYSVRLLEGRLPTSSNEIVIPQALTLKPNEGMLELGEQVTLDLGQRQAFTIDGELDETFSLTHDAEDLNKIMINGTTEKLVDTTSSTYTIVGVIKNSVWDRPWGGSRIVVTALDETLLSQVEHIDILGTTYEYKSRAMFDHMRQLGETVGVEYSVNNGLLRYSLLSSVDSLQITLYGLTVSIMAIVIVGSVSLIYNAFGISVADRSKYLGMLASVGATKRQKRNSVFYEAGLISLVSIPFGVLAGYLGLLVTFNVINNILNTTNVLNVSTSLEVVVTPLSIVVSIIISLITIFVSAWLPARRASKITAIDAIRMSYDVKITKRQVKNNRLVRKIFGIEADIALKNLKRNKRRYQVTVFSLIISIVLFVSAAYFTTLLKKGTDLASSDINYQVSASVHHERLVEFNPQELLSHEGIQDYAIVRQSSLTADIAEQHFTDDLKKHLEEQIFDMNEDGSVPYNVLVYSLDDKSFMAYAQEQGITGVEWHNPDNLNAIVVNKTIYESRLNQKKVEDVQINNAQGLELEMYEDIWNEKEQQVRLTFPTVTIAGVASDTSKWLPTSATLTSLMIVLPEKQYEQFIRPFESNYVDYDVYIKTDMPSEVSQHLLEIDHNDVKLNVWNVQEYYDQMNGITLILNIFVFGFIGLITLISIANIMNTISTGLQLRKREFAMLRSMGMTQKGFYRMINYESIFYGIKSLSYGLPISLGLVYLMYMSMTSSMSFKFTPPWLYFGLAILGIFIIVTIVMYYAGSKIKKGSIVESIKQDNI